MWHLSWHQALLHVNRNNTSSLQPHFLLPLSVFEVCNFWMLNCPLACLWYWNNSLIEQVILYIRVRWLPDWHANDSQIDTKTDQCSDICNDHFWNYYDARLLYITVSLVCSLFSVLRKYEDCYLFLWAFPRRVTMTYSMAPWYHFCTSSLRVILIEAEFN